MKNINERIPLIVSVLVLVIVGWAAYSVVSNVQQATGDLVSPVNALGTQASEMLNPTPTIIPNPITIIHEVRSLARLETIQYTLEKVITAQSNQGQFGFLFGDKLLFVAHGKVIAGIDLERLDAEDLTLRNGVLYVDLPPAEIFVNTLDNEKSYVYNRETGFLSQGDVNLETTARQAAEEAILESALEDGILEQAELNAENYLARLFRNLGYPDVVFLRDEGQ